MEIQGLNLTQHFLATHNQLIVKDLKPNINKVVFYLPPYGL